MKIDKKQLIIYIGIIAIIGIVIISYILSKTEDEKIKYNELQIETTKTEENLKEVLSVADAVCI